MCSVKVGQQLLYLTSKRDRSQPATCAITPRCSIPLRSTPGPINEPACIASHRLCPAAPPSPSARLDRWLTIAPRVCLFACRNDVVDLGCRVVRRAETREGRICRILLASFDKGPVRLRPRCCLLPLGGHCRTHLEIVTCRHTTLGSRSAERVYHVAVGSMLCRRPRRTRPNVLSLWATDAARAATSSRRPTNNRPSCSISTGTSLARPAPWITNCSSLHPPHPALWRRPGAMSSSPSPPMGGLVWRP